jgi:hypothetical protein
MAEFPDRVPFRTPAHFRTHPFEYPEKSVVVAVKLFSGMMGS